MFWFFRGKYSIPTAFLCKFKQRWDKKQPSELKLISFKITAKKFDLKIELIVHSKQKVRQS
jgi:hypothetical protein